MDDFKFNNIREIMFICCLFTVFFTLNLLVSLNSQQQRKAEQFHRQPSSSLSLLHSKHILALVNQLCMLLFTFNLISLFASCLSVSVFLCSLNVNRINVISFIFVSIQTWYHWLNRRMRWNSRFWLTSDLRRKKNKNKIRYQINCLLNVSLRFVKHSLDRSIVCRFHFSSVWSKSKRRREETQLNMIIIVYLLFELISMKSINDFQCFSFSWISFQFWSSFQHQVDHWCSLSLFVIVIKM